MNFTSPSSTLQTETEVHVADTEKKSNEIKLKYQHISDDIRNQVVTRFLVDGHKLIDISRDLKVNYSSAKTIIKVFREQKRIKKIQPNQRHIYLKKAHMSRSDDEDYERVVNNMKLKIAVQTSEESEFEPEVTKKTKKTTGESNSKVCGIRYLDEHAHSTNSESTQTKLEEPSTPESKVVEEIKKPSLPIRQNASFLPKQCSLDSLKPPVDLLAQLGQYQVNFSSPLLCNSGRLNFCFGGLPMRQMAPPLINFGFSPFGNPNIGLFNGYL